MNKSTSTHCGYIAILGRPNVGKSTLLNCLLEQKISITSKKPQTTRHQILGIKTTGNTQAVFIDTPGIHKGGKRAINRYMNRAASVIIEDVDLILFMIEANKWTDEDGVVLDKVKQAHCPVILVANKIDRFADKALLLPKLQELKDKYTFAEIVPISAEKHENIDRLNEVINRYLPPGEFIFPEDQLTDKNERFIAAELIREKLMRILGEELPYSLTVEIEQFQDTKKILRISAIIWVERESQKGIVIGAKGEQLKKIGTEARCDLERWFDKKVYLQLWVKVKENWSDDERLLKNFGYQL